MKHATFDHSSQRWDTYRAFHVSSGPWTIFSSGEVILNRHPAPHQRRYYDHLGLQIASTAGSDCPRLHFDRECTKPIPGAWLTQSGLQNIVIDHEQGVAFKIKMHYGNATEFGRVLGAHVQRAAAYWAGPNVLPTAFGKIRVSQPDGEYKKQMRSTLRQVRSVLRASARLQGVRGPYDTVRWAAHPWWMGSSVEEICANVLAWATNAQDNYMLRCIAFNGFNYPRIVSEHEFLYVRRATE